MEQETKQVQQGTKRKAKGLTTRQKALRKWLDDNFVQGKFFSIEEIVRGCVDEEGKPYYALNCNARIHDKCLALANDIKQLNRKTTENFIPIVKDNKGGCKLAENEDEVKDFIEALRAEARNKAIYCNIIISKTNMEGVIPLIDFNDKPLSVDEMKPIEVYK